MTNSIKTVAVGYSAGNILLLCLVLLLLMTLLAVATIDNAGLQSQMAHNSRSAQSAYQKSLGEIEAQYQRLKNISELQRIADSPPLAHQDNRPGIQLVDSQTQTYTDDEGINLTVDISFTGEGPAPAAYSLAHYRGLRFEINSNTSPVDGGLRSQQTQGLVLVLPTGQ